MSNIRTRIRLFWAKFLAWHWRIDRYVIAPFERLGRRRQEFLDRRPHRSFRRTRRRDYVRSLKLPGYWLFSVQVMRHVWRYKKVFLRLAALYAILSAVLVGLASQSTFTELSDTLKGTNFFNGSWGNLGQSGLLFLATMTGSLNNTSANGTQTAIGLILVLIVWLTTVWLMRSQLAGNEPRLRDGLYRAGAPIIALFVVVFYAVVQLIPAALGAMVAAVLFGFGETLGVIGALGWVVTVLLFVVSLYWLTSTFLAAIVITLPGMYPWQAIRIAGDLAVGRRTRILLRVIWAAVLLFAASAIVLVPLILLVIWLNDTLSWMTNIPVIPLAVLFMTTLGLIWMGAYIYLLYRRIVEDGSISGEN